MSERRVNLFLHGVCGLGVFEETLAKRSFDTFAQSTGKFVVVKLQLWQHYVSAAVANPTAFRSCSHHTSQCTSGDDAFATQIPCSTLINQSWRFTGVGRLCGNQWTRSVFSYVTVRGWCLWRRNVFNLSSPTLHVREIPFPVFHATFPPFPYTCRLDSSRARPARSENIARSITPSTRVAWSRTQLLLFVLRFLPK